MALTLFESKTNPIKETLDFELYLDSVEIHADPNRSYAMRILEKGLSCDGSKEDFLGDNRELCPKAGGALNNGRGPPLLYIFLLRSPPSGAAGAPYTLARSLIAHSSHSLALPANPAPATPDHVNPCADETFILPGY